MSVNSVLLRSRLARRVFVLFIISAVVPTVILGVVAYRQVVTELDRQARDRLRSYSKALGMGLIERLQMAAAALAVVPSLLDGDLAARGDTSRSANPVAINLNHFRSVVVVTDWGSMQPVRGEPQQPPPLPPEQRAHLRTGQPAVVVAPSPSVVRVYLAGQLPGRDSRPSVVWGELDPEQLFLAGPARAALPPDTELCVFDARRVPLYCSTAGMRDHLVRYSDWHESSAGVFTWQGEGGEAYVAGFWSMFLRSGFGGAEWKVLVSEQRSTIVAPIDDFRRTFPLVLALGLGVVFLASNVQIRRVLHPIVALMEGTRCIADRDFARPVEVESGDEFEALAESFNGMAARLDRQFRALTTSNEIDRAVLSKVDRRSIVDTALAGAQQVLGSEGVAICLAPASPEESRWTIFATDGTEPGQFSRRIALGESDLESVRGCTDHLIVSADQDPPRYLLVPAFAAHGLREYLVLPVRWEDELCGLIAFGFTEGVPSQEEDLTQARHLADQIGVALANAELIERLDALSLGAQQAFARSIDAKSKWTAGHAERVTRIAMVIAREMDLTKDALETLHRGALLHDIGKIGVPAALLDKPGPLTDDEMRVMQSHTTIGARILDPITAYADIIPIVRHHHERYDGKGYPDKLAGDDIPMLARIVAVADVWDALTSMRPYRPSWKRLDAARHIIDQAGTHFDPGVVQVFQRVVEELPTSTPSVPGGPVTTRAAVSNELSVPSVEEI